MLVQILASSAWIGVVWTTGAPSATNGSAATSPERSPIPPTMHGRVEISWKNRDAAIRSGTWATKTSSPTVNPRCISR